MGIEMRLHLIDEESLNFLLNLHWNEMYVQLEKGLLREKRPPKDTKLSRSFDIDAESDILDLMDQAAGEGRVIDVLKMQKNHSLLLLLMEWASFGHWESWEGRCFIYLEQAIGNPIEHVDDMYDELCWEKVNENLRNIGEDQFAKDVCENWMKRREALGETLDEREDPHIMPTFEAHDKAARKLHHAVNRLNCVQILGREHLDAKDWGHGNWNLEILLEASD